MTATVSWPQVLDIFDASASSPNGDMASICRHATAVCRWRQSLWRGRVKQPRHQPEKWRTPARELGLLRSQLNHNLVESNLNWCFIVYPLLVRIAFPSSFPLVRELCSCFKREALLADPRIAISCATLLLCASVIPHGHHPDLSSICRKFHRRRYHTWM